MRHVMEDLGSVCPFVQILDLPVPQTVDYVTDALRMLDRPMAEQVIEVPTISCSPCPSRSPIPEPQTAEQLVEVPTVLSPTRIALRIAEQLVDTPVPQGRGKRRGQGFLPGQSSTAVSSAKRISERTVEQIVDIPSSGGGLAHESSSSAGPADEDFTGLFALFPMEKKRSAGQVVSARLGEHVSSSTLSAHQMARAGEPVDSDGSDVWVLVRLPNIGKSYYWNRRTNSTTRVAPAGVEVVWVAEKPERGNVWCWNQVTGLTAHKLPPLPPG